MPNSALPAHVLPAFASGYRSLKETRFLPGALYVGQIPFQQCWALSILSQNSPGPSSWLLGWILLQGRQQQPVDQIQPAS